MLCLQLVNYFHIHDLPWFSQQSWKERRKEGRKGQKAISFLVLQMKRCCFLRLTAGNLVGNRAGSPDVCQDCSHSEPKLSTGYMPQGRHSTQELQHRLSHFICTTANMLLGGWVSGGKRRLQGYGSSKVVPLASRQARTYSKTSTLPLPPSCLSNPKSASPLAQNLSCVSLMGVRET